MAPRSTVRSWGAAVPDPDGESKSGARSAGADDVSTKPLSARGARARAEIEDAARELFATRGYFRTTVEDIAAATGRSNAAFYQYFASREQLLMALSGQFLRDVPARAGATAVEAESADDWTFFLAATRLYWKSYASNLGVMVAVFQLATVDKRFAERQTQIRNHGLNVITETLRRAQDLGYGSGVDPEVAAGAIAAMFEHFSFVILGQGGGDPSVDEEKAIRTLATLWHRTVCGNLPQEPRSTSGQRRRD